MHSAAENVTIQNEYPEKINILMVDDHPENLLALEAVLMSPNYCLVSAHSGEEALKCILQQDFAVILLDVQLPGLDGFETAKMIKVREKSRHIPIIFITAISKEVEHVLQGYSVGAIDYIFKPFHPDALKRKIEQFVKIQHNHERIMVQSEREHTLELEKMTRKLDRTTMDLRKTEALSKVIGETLTDTIVTFDEEGYIYSINPAVNVMFGYTAEESLGRHIDHLLPEVKQDEGKTGRLDVNSSDKPMTGKLLEAIALRKDGSRFPADIQIGEASIDNQRLYVCTIRDVTERKKLEEVQKQQYSILEKLVEERTLELLSANENLQKQIDERNKIADDLRISQERFQKIFQSSPCLMAIRSLKTGKYMDVNPNWLNYTGYSYEEAKNHSSDVPHFVTNSDDSSVFKRSIESGEVVHNGKICYLTKSGEKRHGLLSTELMEIQGDACVLIVITDVTERTLLEKEMARLDRLNLIGEMAAGIAHEIRNPMTTVRGFLQMSKKNDNHLSKHVIDLMVEELDRANSIIVEYLNLAKNKINEKTLQSLNEIIESLYPLIQAEALLSGKRVQLELEACPELYLDEKEIRQLVLNLSMNGLDAMSSGGTLTIKTYSDKQAVVLEVRDQGSGIKPEVLEKIGTPFFTTKDKGTGLGLPICYSVADRHNAVIDIQTGDQGAAFFIRFRLGDDEC